VTVASVFPVAAHLAPNCFAVGNAYHHCTEMFEFDRESPARPGAQCAANENADLLSTDSDS